MNFKVFIAVFSVLGVAYSSDTIEYEEKIDAMDTNGQEEESVESESGESFVSTRPAKYYWVPQTTRYGTPAADDASIEVATKALADSFKNISRHFDKPLGEFKFAASVQRKGAHYATGALINSKWVLTTAKEFFNVRESMKLFRLRLGSTDCKRGGILFPIKEILIHPLYKVGGTAYDLALLRLAVPVEENEDVEPIVLAQYKDCNKFVTTYWPRVIYNDILLPSSAPERFRHSHLRVSTQTTLPWRECYKWMSKRNFTLHESTLCLKPILAKHSKCMPDAGAPVLSGDGLWGVTSGWKAPGCLTDPSPTLVTRTAAAGVDLWLKKWTASPLWNPGGVE